MPSSGRFVIDLSQVLENSRNKPKSLIGLVVRKQGLLWVAFFIVTLVMLFFFYGQKRLMSTTTPNNRPTLEVGNVIENQQQQFQQQQIQQQLQQQLQLQEEHQQRPTEILRPKEENLRPKEENLRPKEENLVQNHQVSNSESQPERQEAVKAAFLHAWRGYEQYAWGSDELKPISKRGDNNWGGVAATLVDSLDTIWIMDLKEEFQKARDKLSTLSFNKFHDASVFESTIRFLGGLLAAYELSGDKIFLDKAEEFAKCLSPAFNTPTGVPYLTVNLETGKAYNPDWTGGCTFLSEFASIQLEWKSLGHLTGKKEYYEKADNINKVIAKLNVKNYDGLFPVTVNPNGPSFCSSHITFGARGDSFYEYLLKQYIQTKQTDQDMISIYKRAMEGMKNKLIKKSHVGNLTYVAQWHYPATIVEEMDHLVCFVAGTLAMDNIPGHLDLAKEIMYTCWQFYEQNPTGIAPEIAGFSRKNVPFHNQAPHYLLRPETVESLFILYRITADPIYREWGWKIFLAIEKHCKTDVGYAALHDVGRIPATQQDRMDSFFLAETLKYLYLLFSPKNLIPLDEFVFNTEAHPTRVFTPKW